MKSPSPSPTLIMQVTQQDLGWLAEHDAAALPFPTVKVDVDEEDIKILQVFNRSNNKLDKQMNNQKKIILDSSDPRSRETLEIIIQELDQDEVSTDEVSGDSSLDSSDTDDSSDDDDEKDELVSYNFEHLLVGPDPKTAFGQYDCYCGDRFQSRKAFKKHLASQRVADFECDLCGEIFTCVEQLKDHWKVVHQDICPGCGTWIGLN